MSRICLRAAVGVFCAGTMLAFASGAFAAGTITSDDRSISAFMTLIDPDASDTTFNPPSVGPAALGSPFGTFLSFDDSSPSFGAEGNVFVDQDTQFNASPDFSVFSGAGFADSSAFTFIGGAQASVDAESEVLFEFNITEPHNYAFTGDLAKSNDAGALVRARLRPSGGSNIFFTTDAGSFMDGGVLAPGDYEVQVRASILDSTIGGSFALDASFNNVVFMITPVPEPATFGLLAVGMFVALRRRRAKAWFR